MVTLPWRLDMGEGETDFQDLKIAVHVYLLTCHARVFYKLYENANIGIFVFAAWNKKNLSDKMLPLWE